MEKKKKFYFKPTSRQLSMEGESILAGSAGTGSTEGVTQGNNGNSIFGN